MTEPDRFAFGDNWRRFVEDLDEAQIDDAVDGLRATLRRDSLAGLSFLDIGSGSGLHSLAALKLGAARVHSFDYDADSVSTTRRLWEAAGCPEQWTVERGSALDRDYLATLRGFDVVYSWGVLHHTGQMWDAIRNAAHTCDKPGALLLIGIYHRRRLLSDAAWAMKWTYVHAGPVGRRALVESYRAFATGWGLVRGRGLRDKQQGRRGMSRRRDVEDWVGGYPFEYATPDELQAFVEPLGFELVHATDRKSFAAINELLFRRIGA